MTGGEIPKFYKDFQGATEEGWNLNEGASLNLAERASFADKLIKNPDVVRVRNLRDLVKAAGGEEQGASIMREHVRQGEEKPYYKVTGAVAVMVAPEGMSDLLEQVMELEAKEWLREEYGVKVEELTPEKLEVMICGKIPLLTAAAIRKKPESTLVGRSSKMVKYLFEKGRVEIFRENPEIVYKNELVHGKITGGEEVSSEEVKEEE